MPKHKVNATAASLLGFLHERPMAGWDLVAVIHQRTGNFWSLTTSQVYRELASMAENGLIEAGPRGQRDRQPYTITDAGREAFLEWLTTLPGKETIRFPLLLTVLFGEHLPPHHLLEFLRKHRVPHAQRLEADEQAYAQLPKEVYDQNRLAFATMEFGIAYETAALEWFDNLIAWLEEQERGDRK